MSHGFGGSQTGELINKLIFEILYSEKDHFNGNDGAVLSAGERVALSTDSFVVSPLFFGEKSIGHLCVAGSVNDVLTCGAVPKYLTLSFIIEEGFEIESLKKILSDIKEECQKNSVRIVTGDTKVVPQGLCDGIYINTACLGEIKKIFSPKNIKPGDKILLSGTIGDHEAYLTILRNNLPFKSHIESDVAGLSPVLVPLLEKNFNIKAMRDPTRGGLATTLNELSSQCGYDFVVEDRKIPINDEVKAFCEITGLDKYTFASEGKMIIFVDPSDEKELLFYLKSYDNNAETIGEVTAETTGRVFLKTLVGTRILPMPTSGNLPRIC